jgi:hypothetical protein
MAGVDDETGPVVVGVFGVEEEGTFRLAKLNPAGFGVSVVCWPKLKPVDTGLAVGGDEIAGVPNSPLAGVVDPKNWGFGAAGVEAGVVVSAFTGRSGLNVSSESISVSLETGASTLALLEDSLRALLKPPSKNEVLGSFGVSDISSFVFGSALNVEPRTKPLDPNAGLLSALFAAPPKILPLSIGESAIGEPKAFEADFEPNILPAGLAAAPAAAKPPFEANAANPDDGAGVLVVDAGAPKAEAGLARPPA